MRTDDGEGEGRVGERRGGNGRGDEGRERAGENKAVDTPNLLLALVIRMSVARARHNLFKVRKRRGKRKEIEIV